MQNRPTPLDMPRTRSVSTNHFPVRYSYRNLPITAAEPALWYVAGEDTIGGSGVLEWCTSEEDAKARLALMKGYEQFRNLGFGCASDESGDEAFGCY